MLRELKRIHTIKTTNQFAHKKTTCQNIVNNDFSTRKGNTYTIHEM